MVNIRYINCCFLQPKILTNVGSLTKLEYLGDSLEAKFHLTDSQVSLIMKIFNSSKTVLREEKNEDYRYSMTCSESQLSQQFLEGDRIFLGSLRSQRCQAFTDTGGHPGTVAPSFTTKKIHDESIQSRAEL